ncbi:MarR family winged helix-turn-helix transcriptional regulator [Actinoplanes sp. CA-131856]
MATDHGTPGLAAVRALTALHRRAGGRLRVVLEPRGLVPADLDVLEAAAAAGADGITLSDLAVRIDVSTGGLTRMVHRLARSGLIERRPSASDRRVAYAVISERGRSALAEIVASGVADEHLAGELAALCADLRRAVETASRQHGVPDGAHRVVGA